MATYPTSKVHRPSRRTVGKGQGSTIANVNATLTNPSANVVQLAFSSPVVVTGIIPLTTSAGAFVSQAIINSSTVQQTFTVSQATATVALPSGAANVSTYQGNKVNGTAITF